LWLHPPRQSGWYLRFFPDGSAQAQYESGLADGANITKGTVHFGALVNAAERLKSDQQADRVSQVSVHFKNETQKAYFLKDDTLFRYLIDSFDGQWQQEFGIERFQQLRRQYPIYKDN
jgi:sugar diacid utilization regulator